MNELSIIVPTFNEVANIRLLYDAIEKALPSVVWEIIFVDDDSTDGTLEALTDLCKEKPNARRLHRIGRRGLSSAVVEGFLACVSPFLAVIDGDLQHDETKLAEMLCLLKTGKTDLALGSRYVAEGGFGEWDADRIRTSKLATATSRLIARQPISDPMSGFFMMKREVLDLCVRHLSLQGYKLLLDIVTSYPGKIRISDVAYQFRVREHGQSKLDSMVIMEFVFMLIEKLTGGLLPARFVMFSMVGTTGVLVHFAVLYSFLNLVDASFTIAQSGATLVAMTTNFFINNWLTYYDKRLKGKQLIKGLLTFYGVCSIGSLANIGVASYIFGMEYTWWVSGLAGVLVGTVWNYAATSLLAWRN
ncbi:glycosyltransferase family 2 protein [Deltaproteobacteria bacterium IMCC39524]|nr:glycosyltransferase family 2 protein [Deltaproteobacteria bacterium IMCC39524]